MMTTDACPPLICRAPECGEWILCDVCGQWFHQPCVGVNPQMVAEIVAYHCLKCETKHGPLVTARKSKRSKSKIDYQALDRGETFAVPKLWHPHISRLLAFQNQDDVTVTVITDAKQFTAETPRDRPLLIPQGQSQLDALGMRIPTSFTIDDITNLVGDDTAVEVMDVLTQQGVPGWKLGRWRHYFRSDTRDRIRNVISLEISDLSLGQQFQRPLVVRELDLVDRVWPGPEPRPKITTYCLMSVKDSFTDFHIDFGGTLVYYTVFQGGKHFLFYPPTEENLICYTQWCLDKDQNYTWFGDYLTMHKRRTIKPKGGFKVELTKGDVFFIPLGWIHAVYTPEDSLVIGGNYLTEQDVAMQLRICAVEEATHVPLKYRFPQFDQVMWLTSDWLLKHKTTEKIDDDVVEALIQHHKSQVETKGKLIRLPKAITDATSHIAQLEQLRKVKAERDDT